MGEVAEWDDDYAKLARAASQLRAAGGSSENKNEITSVRAGLDRLKVRLRSFEKSKTLNSFETARRRNLVDNLSRQIGGTAGDNTVGAASGYAVGSSTATGGQQTSMALARMRQDDLLDDLAVGVGRLKDQTMMISDEANLHNRLLDDMESDMEAAHSGMENETRRAQELVAAKSLWRLYVAIIVLVILLVILLLTA